MRAVLLDEHGGPELLRVGELADPEPAPTEVLVRVEAAGVNVVDAKTRRGAGVAGLLGVPPWVLGWDLAGVVAAVGAGVTRFSPGDPVLGMPRFPHPAGAYAELATAPARHLALRPPSLSAQAAAALPLKGLTAWQALVDTAGVGAGQRVLVHGASGGVGRLAVQLAHHLGAEVLGTASAPTHERLRALGADVLVDHRSERFEDVVGEVDVVLDLVGAGLPERSLPHLRRGGHLVCIGTRTDLPDAEVLARHDVHAAWMLVEPDHAGLEALTALVADGALRVDVDRVEALADVAAVHADVDAGRRLGTTVLQVT